VLAAAAALLYGLTLSRDFGGDDTVFAQKVDLWLREGGARWLLHPHHLVHLPLVAAVAWVARSLTGAVFVLDAGAWVSVVAAAVVVGGLVPLLRRAGVREGVALLTATVVMVSGGLWQFATMMEVYTLEAAAVLAWLWVVSRERPRWAAVVASVTLAWLSHLVLLLLVPPTLWLLPDRRRAMLAVGVAGLVGPGLVVAAVASFAFGFHTPADLWRWVLTPSMGGYLTSPSPLRAGSALAGTVAWRWFEAVPVFLPSATAWFHGLGSAALLLLLPLPLLGAVVSWRDGPREGRVACLGVAALVPLWMLWDVGNPEHVVGALPLLAVLTGIGAAALPARVGEVLLGAVAALLLVANGAGSAAPRARPENSRTAVIASFVHEQVPREGLVLTAGTDPSLRLGLPYLSGRRVADLTLLAEAARRQGLPPEAALERWLERARAADQLWLLGDVLDPSTPGRVKRLGLGETQWRRAVACLVPGQPVPLSVDPVAVRTPVTLSPAWFDATCGEAVHEPAGRPAVNVPARP